MIFRFLAALSVPYDLLFRDDCLSHSNFLTVTAFLSRFLLFSLSFFLATQRLINCSQLKGKSMTGAECRGAETVCEITWVGCLRERERERVRLASATAVCRYFYQHELGMGRGRGGGRGMGSEKGREGMLEKWKKGAYRRSRTVGKGEGVHGCRKEGIQREIVKGVEEEVEQKG